MNDSFAFLLAVHNHQPVGNFASVFERAFADCYRPFLRELKRHPDVKFTAHYSGPLLEYMRDRAGECWDDLRQMTRRGQVELLGGGFYEPILSIIPEEDRRGQLDMMSRFLEENFGARPRGIWLTERVWEPSLPRLLAEAGISYTLLDEEHFHYAGVKDIHTYYVTEDQGYPLKVFPIDKKLRYLIPFHPPARIEEYFGAIRAGGGLAILGDDGEKFGLWPGTKTWVYQEGWLVRFLEFLRDKGIRTCTYSEIAENRPPAGRVYLPPASYEEMMEWVLEPGDAAQFKEIKRTSPPEAKRYLRGGFFREFFLKYPESNLLNKRMILVSRQVKDGGGDAARRELYQGQCNDASWHGVFGGIYFPHLREAVYAHLLKAESLTEGKTGWTTLDFDLDGREEAVLRNATFGLIAKPDFGGCLVEIDHYPSFRNLTDVLSRRPETYHVRRAPEAESGKSIHERVKELPPESEHTVRYDRRPRFCALDHVLPPETTAEQIERGDYEESGDFADRPYVLQIKENSLHMSRESWVEIGGERIRIGVRKRIEVDARELVVHYRIRHLSGRPAEFLFSSEWNFYQTAEEIELGSSGCTLCGGRLRLDVFPEAEWNAFPLKTLSQSEEGYDIIHQGYGLFPQWRVRLSGDEEFALRIRLSDQGAGSAT